MPTDSERGNATTYTIRRLKRDNPELAECVISGELSANREAGESLREIVCWHFPSRFR